MCSRAIPAQHVFTAVLRVGEKRFARDKAFTDSMAQLGSKTEKEQEKREQARAGHADQQGKDNETHVMWAMLYADGVGILSRSPNGLGRLLTVIVTAFAAFGPTV